MPRFYFHLADGHLVRDEDGTELPDIEAARVNGVKLLGHVVADNCRNFLAEGDWTMTVTDEADKVLLTVSLSAIDPTAATDLS